MRTLALGIGIFFVCVGLFPQSAAGAFVGEVVQFSIDSSFDTSGRSKTAGTLLILSPRAYFYVDTDWWEEQNFSQQSAVRQSLEAAGQEFAGTIHPALTQSFGSEANPGIDGDERITVLLHPMKGGQQGYMRTADGYERAVFPTSNEREMFYLNTDALASPRFNSFLAHEFTHLITFNQKERLRQVNEAIWLNEARAEYAPTLLGYDDVYEGSNLQARVEDFLDESGVSLIEWQNRKEDYGASSLFAQYLVDHYGAGVLRDSLWTSSTGRAAIEEALAAKGFEKSFSEVFEEWVIALLLNDCSIGEYYCYKNEHLTGMRVVPQTNFLPSSGEATLSLAQRTKPWAGNWYRVVGGGEELTVEFRGDARVLSKVPYVVEANGAKTVGRLSLNIVQSGMLEIEGFQDIQSITFLPIIPQDLSALSVLPEYQFTITITSFSDAPEPQNPQPSPGAPALTEAQIGALISMLQSFGADSEVISNVADILRGAGTSSFSFERNLQLGSGGEEVRKLQELLNRDPDTRLAQSGPGSPGNETTFFGPLTRAAVVRFQEKYAAEVLQPLGLSGGTGFVGPSTRAKLNELL